MRRLDLDNARGLAIILIMIGHSNGMSGQITKLIYSFHVPLFFVIAGILLAYNKTAEKRWEYIVRGRVKRIIVPSLVWELILSVSYFFIKDISIGQLIFNSITMQFNLSVLWFIPCFLIAEAIWIILLKNEKTSNQKLCLIGLIIIPIVAPCVPMLFVKRILIGVVFIAVGFLWERIALTKACPKIMGNEIMLSISSIIWIITAVSNVRVDLSAGVLGNSVLYYLHSIAGSIATICLCELMSARINLLSWIGRNTMGFLATHVFVRHAIVMVEERIMGFYFDGWALAIPLVLIDIIVVWVINRILPELIGQKRLTSGVKTD